MRCYKLIVFESSNDTAAEHELVRLAALEHGAHAAVVSTHWSDGGRGATRLAEALVDACENVKPKFRFLYDVDSSIEAKIETIAKEMYGAGSIEYSPKVREIIKLYNMKVIRICSQNFKMSMFTLVY